MGTQNLRAAEKREALSVRTCFARGIISRFFFFLQTNLYGVNLSVL